MIKNIIAIILLSAGIILAAPYVQSAIEMLVSYYEWLLNLLNGIFTSGEALDIAKKMIALLAAPFLTALIPAFIYWLIKRSAMPHFMCVVWTIWLIQTSALVVLTKL